MSFAAAAQTTDSEGRIIIDSKEKFLKIGVDANYPLYGDYIQTANIDLGDKGTMYTPIITTFSGMYDGGGYTISYKATFAGSSHDDYHTNGDYALFGYVNGGTLKNMSVSGEVLMTAASGSPDNMNVALLCGHTNNYATIDHCNVVGSVSTYINASNGGGADAALMIGQADNTIVKYSSGSGNVVGVGWVGGLIGSCGSGTIKACTFSGQVEAIQPSGNTNVQVTLGYGGFAGGIVGMAGATGNTAGSAGMTVTIDLCYVNADITVGQVASGIASVAVGARTAKVINSCAEGTLTGNSNNRDYIPQGEEESDITNSRVTTTNTHESNDKPVDVLEQIVTDLNNGRATGEKAEFDVVDGKIVLYPDGKPKAACAAVTGLTISSVTPGRLTCSWTAGGSETAWSVSILGGDLAEDITREVTTDPTVTIEDARLTISPSNYVLSVVAKCSETSLSVPATSSFVISCPTIAGMSVTTPDCTSARVTWTNTETVKAELYRGDTLKATETITSAPTHTFTSLAPNTTYKVRLSAACGGDYGEATERVFTTPSLPIVENVQIAARYENGGSVTITWDYALDGATYQVEVQTSADVSVDNQSGLTTRNYNKSSIAVGSYKARIKAIYQGHEAGWTEWFPFVISNPNAPQNVHWSNIETVDSQYRLTLAWTKGNNNITIQDPTEEQTGYGQGWEIKVADSSSSVTVAYTIEASSSAISAYSQILSDHYMSQGAS